MSKRNRLKRALRRRLKRDHLRGDYSVPAMLTRLEAQVLKETRKEALTILNKAPSLAEWTMKQGGLMEMLGNVAEKMFAPNRKSVEEMTSTASSAESLKMLTIDELLKHNVFAEMPWAPQIESEVTFVFKGSEFISGPFDPSVPSIPQPPRFEFCTNCIANAHAYSGGQTVYRTENGPCQCFCHWNAFGIPLIEDKNILEGTIYAVGPSKITMDGPSWLSVCSACGELFGVNDSDEIDSTNVCGECAEKGL